LEAYEYNLQKSQRMVSRKGVKEAAIAKAIETLREGLPEISTRAILKDEFSISPLQMLKPKLSTVN
jgi:hypothetical protein